MNEVEVLKIGSLSVRPNAMQWSESDLDSSEGSGRNALGDMFRDRICTKRKLSVSFPPMLTSQISQILNAIDPIFFELTYPDPKLGELTTMEVYVSDCSVPVYCFDKASQQWLWQGLAVDFMER